MGGGEANGPVIRSRSPPAPRAPEWVATTQPPRGPRDDRQRRAILHCIGMPPIRGIPGPKAAALMHWEAVKFTVQTLPSLPDTLGETGNSTFHELSARIWEMSGCPVLAMSFVLPVTLRLSPDLVKSIVGSLRTHPGVFGLVMVGSVNEIE